MARLGFSITPEEVTRFKQSAIEDMNNDDSTPEESNNDYKQWVATMTGKGTFHGMGIICVDSKPTGSFGNIPSLKEGQELWLLYMNYICIVKAFVFAERTSNGELHLDVLSEMLNLFAAAGHINYAKSARLYLQE